MGNVIEVTGLRKRYGDLQAVDGVDLSVEQGEFYGILGPNGAGKTTTLEMVEGLREPDEGQITVLGEKVWPRNTALLPRMGVQLQAGAFFGRLTAREQLSTFADLYGVGQDRVARLLQQTGLEEKARTQVEKLSGGQRQRLSIACSLVHDPEVVFLDEPTAALDPQARRNLWEVLRSLQGEGRTVVLTTHHMDEAEILCDRVAIMDSGRVLKVDTPKALVHGLAAPTRVTVPDAGLDRAELARLAGAEPEVADGFATFTTTEPTRLIGRLAELGHLDGLQVRGATLEDVFLDLTGREYRA